MRSAGTTDPDSMLWSGRHPQDLRVELFDAKNQRYMIDKMIGREKAQSHAVRAIVRSRTISLPTTIRRIFAVKRCGK